MAHRQIGLFALPIIIVEEIFLNSEALIPRKEGNGNHNWGAMGCGCLPTFCVWDILLSNLNLETQHI